MAKCLDLLLFQHVTLIWLNCITISIEYTLDCCTAIHVPQRYAIALGLNAGDLPKSCIPFVEQVHGIFLQDTFVVDHREPFSDTSVSTPHDTCIPNECDLNSDTLS